MEALWLSKLKSFRGHLLINPPSAEELQLEEIEELKKSEWHLEKWQANGKPEYTHDHCGICWQAIYETDNQTKSFGYNNSEDWICQKCYVEHLRQATARPIYEREGVTATLLSRCFVYP